MRLLHVLMHLHPIFLFALLPLLGGLRRLVGSSSFHPLAVFSLLPSAFPLRFLLFPSSLRCSLLFSRFPSARPALSLLPPRPALISCSFLLCFLSSFLSSLTVSLRKLCYFAKERRKWDSRFTQLGKKLVFLTQSREETAWMREPQSYFQEAKTSSWLGRKVHMAFKS